MIVNYLKYIVQYGRESTTQIYQTIENKSNVQPIDSINH